MEEVERAYLAGLFDGEGCANATFRSKAYKEKRYWWPAVQFVIAGQYQHMCQISEMFGAGGNVYEQSNRRVCEFRATKPEHVLRFIDIILPYVKLKKEQLRLLRSATGFMIEHRSRSKWSQKDKEFFNKNFVQTLQKSTRTGEKKGRKRTHTLFMNRAKEGKLVAN